MQYNIIALFTALLSVSLLPAGFAADDILIADFEKDTYEPWIVTGEAFGQGPAKGTLPGQMNVEGYRGKGLVNSFFKGDDSTGSLTSPRFRIERKHLSLIHI
jgi:fructan beta-fructosidase